MIIIILLIAALGLLLFAVYLETRIDRDTETMISDLEDEIDALEQRLIRLERKNTDREDDNERVSDK